MTTDPLKAVHRELEDSYHAAVPQAYANRHPIRWVERGTETHARLGEAYQRSRESAWDDATPAQREELRKNPYTYRKRDGSAPDLRMIFGLEVRLSAAPEGITWDVGVPCDPHIQELFADLREDPK